MKFHCGSLTIAVMLALQGCATATPRAESPSIVSESAAKGSATTRNLLQQSPQAESGPSVVMDTDPYEGKRPPDICHRGWLAPAIAFKSGSSELVPCAIRVLDESIKISHQYPDLRVEVAGHTNSSGSDADNKALSLRRAQVVYDYLIAHDVPASTLLGPVGYGSERLLVVDTGRDGSINEDAAQANDRVELNVQN